MPPAICLTVLGDRDPGHRTHRALDAALARAPNLRARWVASDAADAARTLDADAVWIAPGTPHRDTDAVLAAIGRARTHSQPLLATCGGFQLAAIELARAAGHDARHAELEPDAAAPLIAPLACSLVGETRPVTPVPGTRLAQLMGTAPFPGFHWCGYGLRASGEDVLVAAGATIAARAPDAGVEAFELSDHPFFVATLFQPQVEAERGVRPPLLQALLEASRAGLAPRANTR